MSAKFSPLIDNLIERLRCLPGVGPKSAQRMAFHLLEHKRHEGQQLADILKKTMLEIAQCNQCRTFSETPVCAMCARTNRDPAVLCVVESPADVLAIEQTGNFKGYYFVLRGHLSPLDGIGPSHLGLDQLESRFQTNVIQEIIMATNATVEGDITADYIANVAKKYHITATRIAYGVPIGGELEYLDGGTLARAFSGRVEMY